MPVRFSSRAPSDALDRIREHLAQDADVPTTRGMKVLRGRPAMSTSDGIETWVLALDDAEVGALERAQPTAWRYLVFEGDRAISEAHLHTEAGVSQVSGMVEGPTTAGLLGAFAVVEGLGAAQAHDFEPRVLLVPSVTFVALWLHAEEADDLFVPIPPSQLPLPHDTAATESQVVSALAVAARELRAAIAAAPGPSGGSGGDASVSPPEPSEGRRAPGLLRLRPLELDGIAAEREEAAKGKATRGVARAPVVRAAKQLPRFMQAQEHSNWCWAAVATSVGLLLETGSWTQCDTASRCFSPRRKCCDEPAICNDYGYLDEALRKTKSLDFHEEVSDFQEALPTLRKRLARHLDHDRPVCARVAWNKGGAHFVTVTGYSLDGDEMTITIQDPQYGLCSMLLVDFPAKYPPGSGTWTNTYYCKR